jgi:hypothetical protein
MEQPRESGRLNQSRREGRIEVQNAVEHGGIDAGVD